MDKGSWSILIGGLITGVFGANGYTAYRAGKPKQDVDISKINIENSVILMEQFKRMVTETEQRYERRISEMEQQYVMRIGEFEQRIVDKDAEHAKAVKIREDKITELTNQVEELRTKVDELLNELSTYKKLPITNNDTTI